MKKGKKKVLIIVIISLTFLITALVIMIISYKPLFYRFYLGDRITGVVDINVNNSPANIKENSIKCTNVGNSREKSSYDFETGK